MTGDKMLHLQASPLDFLSIPTVFIKASLPDILFTSENAFIQELSTSHLVILCPVNDMLAVYIRMV